MFRIPPGRNTTALHFAILFSAIVLFVVSIDMFKTGFTSEAEITPVSGRVVSTTLFNTTTINSRTGQTMYQCNLAIALTGSNKEFKLTEPSKHSEKLRNIRAGLRIGAKASVYVRKKDLAEIQPKIFRIDIEDKTLLKLGNVTNDNVYCWMFCILASLGALLLFVNLRYPHFVKKYL